MAKSKRSPSILKKIDQLRREIKRHQELYYVDARPELSDEEFDALVAELAELESAHPELVTVDSPTQKVGSDLTVNFEKFQHTIEVLSLGNLYSAAEVETWLGRTLRTAVAESELSVAEQRFLLQWKVDGVSLVLYYESGELVRAVTRGSGQVGDVVTANARTIDGLPLKLKHKVDLVVRGECFMSFSDFRRFNAESGEGYANPRNLTAGSLKHKSSAEAAKRPLSFVAYEVHFGAGARGELESFRSDYKALKEAGRLGLPLFGDLPGPLAAKRVVAAIEELGERRDSLDFPVDGLVLKLDHLPSRRLLGSTAHSPRWAVAYKFAAEIGESRIERIELFVGRTGRITPRAELTPVALAGTTVRFATLHNDDYIRQLGVRVGARVRVSKRGEIIPAVEEVIDPGDGAGFEMVTSCPCCSTSLEREEDAAHWFCPNVECDDRLRESLIFFCQRKQMDLPRLGERSVSILFEYGFIRYIEDLYRLADRRNELESLPGMGERSVAQMLNGIEASKSRAFRRLLPALGLREIGPAAAEALIDDGLDSIDKLLALSDQAASGEAGREAVIERISAIDGLGRRTAELIIVQFAEEPLRRRIEALRTAGLQLEAAAGADGTRAGGDVDFADSELEPIFFGQSWCITGSFESFRPRELAGEEIKRRGGKVVAAVSKKTTHLLAGSAAGSKLAKAEEFGVEVVDEAGFLRRLGSARVV